MTQLTTEPGAPAAMSPAATPPPNAPAGRFLDPAAVARLRSVPLAARLIVEGLLAGQHRSPRKGLAIEFAEHRPYAPGDDPRHLDWKVLARRDRLYLKQFEEQTNLRGLILLDTSSSMGYRHRGAMTKLDYARFCAAALAYLLHRQHDAFGLTTLADRALTQLPPRQGSAHLHAFYTQLEAATPAGTTDLPATLHEAATRLSRRAMIIVISDCLGGRPDASDLLEAVGHVRHRKHELIVLQVVDPAEVTFPFDDAGEIVDSETGRVVIADARAVRDHYRAAFARFQDTLRRGCSTHGVTFSAGTTDQPFDQFLLDTLSRRAAYR